MNDFATPRPMEILLVEDNPGDVMLTREALEISKVNSNLHVVGDGVEAMEFLRKGTAAGDTPVPDIILLDLNLPRKSGHEVLEEIKTDHRLCQIPVVVLTVSSDERDVVKVYERHANCFITKPVHFSEFQSIVRDIEHFWFKTVTLPTRACAG